MTQPIATAIAGSLPKPAWLAQPEKLWAPWQLSGEALEQAKIDAMRLAVDDQLRAGITIIGDGEQTRQHFVTTFIEHLDGVDFVHRKTVRIRDRYDAEVPTVVGDGVNGFVSNNLEYLEEGMLRLLSDHATAREMGQRSQEIARERFSIERFARDWERAFEMVLGRPGLGEDPVGRRSDAEK